MSPEPKQQKPGGRVVGLDVARGALMAYVIIVIHGVFWLGLLPQPWSTVLLFEMPPIFVITGAAFFYAERGKPLTFGSYAMFIARRFLRILAPYWAYALAAVAIVLAFGISHDPAAALMSWLNPGTRGSGHTFLMLSWHLWFVPPFLAVTALLPFLSRIPAPKLPLPVWAAIGAGVVLAATALDPTHYDWQTIAFYALWAVFGIGLVAAPGRYGLADYALMLALSFAAMAVLVFLLPDATLNMQANKFPPNVMFFAFSCAWMAVLLIVSKVLTDETVEKFAASPLLKPFIASGYSLYLWQGVGYTAAAYVGRAQGWSPWIIWPIAIALTVVLGLMASPLERLKIPRSKSFQTAGGRSGIQGS
ncbi:acyltransferase family protein [Terricaulis sp.]|uniref:acyltransferase family protein n=1 Tax=Terricaulis sp. TaxID=2768686 RepID=UPI00378340DA